MADAISPTQSSQGVRWIAAAGLVLAAGFGAVWTFGRINDDNVTTTVEFSDLDGAQSTSFETESVEGLVAIEGYEVVGVEYHVHGVSGNGSVILTGSDQSPTGPIITVTPFGDGISVTPFADATLEELFPGLDTYERIDDGLWESPDLPRYFVRSDGDWTYTTRWSNVPRETALDLTRNLQASDSGLRIRHPANLKVHTERLNPNFWGFTFENADGEALLYSRSFWPFTRQFHDADPSRVTVLNQSALSLDANLRLVEWNDGYRELVWPADNGFGHHAIVVEPEQRPEDIAANIRSEAIAGRPDLQRQTDLARGRVENWARRTPVPPGADTEVLLDYWSTESEDNYRFTKQAACLWVQHWNANRQNDEERDRAISALRRAHRWPSAAGAQDMALVASSVENANALADAMEAGDDAEIRSMLDFSYAGECALQ